MDRVDPVAARKGTFIKSFPSQSFQDMLNYGFDTEMAMMRHRIAGKLVYTEVGKGVRQSRWSWQIFLISESDWVQYLVDKMTKKQGPDEKHHDNG